MLSTIETIEFLGNDLIVKKTGSTDLQLLEGSTNVGTGSKLTSRSSIGGDTVANDFCGELIAGMSGGDM
jgi:hypothetical protein